MDISKQTNDSCTGASMYFDAESTVSSLGFKTMSDISNSSALGMDIELEQSIDMNSTLEAADANVLDKQQNLLTLKKNTAFNAVSSSPLRPLSKNILQEYRVHCSTPTREQLLRTVEVARGSDAARCIDLGIAFKSVEEEEQLSIPVLVAEENKENALPEKSVENSTLSPSSSLEAVTVIAQQKVTEADESVAAAPTLVKEKEVRFMATTSGPTAAAKPRQSLLPKKYVRKSVCEPDLKTNRPSRITMTGCNIPRRTSIAPKSTLEQQINTEIPQLLDKALTIAKKVGVATDKRKSLAVGRPSLLPMPATQAEKRPYQYAQRMSTVVKTTLNSPARKIMRRSVMAKPSSFSAAPSTRRSVMPATVNPPKATTSATTATVKNKLLPSDKPKITPILAKPKISVDFNCSVCGAKFRIKSLLEAHKRSHEDGVPAFVRKAPIAAASATSDGKQCKYCDKKFALVRTLHIHLLQNCTKIPPAEKRKLEYTEMKHVEKAQLPVFTHSTTNSSNASNASSRSHTTLSQLSISSTDSQTGKKDVTVIARELTSALDNLQVTPPNQPTTTMAPPTQTKVKKSSAHAGVYRTPTKSVPCHTCKLSFKSVLQYTNHCMTVHANNPSLCDEA